MNLDALPQGVFSPQIPTLFQTHLKHLQQSAISVDVIRERGYTSVLGKKTLSDLGFSSQCQPPGMLIPVWSPSGENTSHQFRPDNPRTNRRGKTIKYETPKGSGIHLDVPPRCRGDIGNPNLPLWVTEGIKKGDSLASHGACALALMGVWGMVGKNLQGGVTTLSEWRDIALNGRLVYVCYDSDIVLKRPVEQALHILVDYLRRRKANVLVIYLPSSTGEKVGIDDFLSAHSLDDAIKLAKQPEESPILRSGYRVEDGCICRVTIEKGGAEKVQPLCNFAARVTEDITKDDGVELQHYFLVDGTLAGGHSLPQVEVPASSFAGLAWVVSNWGVSAVIAAGLSSKDCLREAIQLMSSNARKRVIYTHTGWRQIGGKWFFLNAADSGLDVELPPALSRYQLPQVCKNAREAVAASLRFLDVASLEITVPLLSAAYTAPLSEINPIISTLILYGMTGSLKTTLACLAISHFGGPFSNTSVPATFESTANYLERLLSQAKDVLLLIDDYFPQPTEAKAREQEQVAQRIIRGQSGHVGRGRLRSDTTMRPRYDPRGLVLATGELLPTGQSTASRMLVIEISKDEVDLEKLSQAQAEADLYPEAMRSYVDWLAPQMEKLKEELPGEFRKLRDQLRRKDSHLHLKVPETIAQFALGWDMLLQHATNVGAITGERRDELITTGFDVLVSLGERQQGRIMDERPTERFLDILANLFAQNRCYLRDRETNREPADYEVWGWQAKETNDGDRAVVAPNAEFLGWVDGEDNVAYLLSEASYKAIVRFAREEGEPFTITKRALHKQLRQEHILIPVNGQSIFSKKIAEATHRVIQLDIGYFKREDTICGKPRLP